MKSVVENVACIFKPPRNIFPWFMLQIFMRGLFNLTKDRANRLLLDQGITRQQSKG
jgi:hypothetical protein